MAASTAIEIVVDEKLTLNPHYTVFRVKSTEIETFINRIMTKSGIDKKAGYRGSKVRPNLMQSAINQKGLVIAVAFKFEGTDNDPAKRFIVKSLPEGLALGTGLQAYHITPEFRKALEGKFIRKDATEATVFIKDVAINHVSVYLDYSAILSTIIGAKIEDIAVLDVIPCNDRNNKEAWIFEIGVLSSAGIYDAGADEDIDASDIPSAYM